MISVGKVLQFILLLSVLLSFVSCSNKKKYHMIQMADAMIGREIKWSNDSIMHEKTLKIITIIPDTGSCTTCSMQVYDWYLYKLDLNNKGLECDIIYVLGDSIELEPEIQKLLGYYNLYYTNCFQSFAESNKEILACTFKTFLVDKNNRIKLVGSPLNNENLWKLYKEVIKKELSEK